MHFAWLCTLTTWVNYFTCRSSTVFELDGEAAAQRVVDVLEGARRRRVAARVAAAQPDEMASSDSEADQASASDGDSEAAEQWATDGLPARGDEAEEWDSVPADVLHLLAGVQVDCTPTRGEVTLLPVDRAAVTCAADTPNLISLPSSLPSIRISSEFVARHIVQVDTASGGIQIDIAPELLHEGMRLQMHAFTRQSAQDEVSGASSHNSEFSGTY